MILLYEYTEERFDIDGNSIGWDSEPRLFPNTFFLIPSLEFNWDDLLVKYNEKWYYFGHLIDDLEKVPTKEEWLAKPGNDVDVEYYTGAVVEYQDNPSGNIKNTKRLTYLMNEKPKFIVNFWYDKLDRVVKMRSIKGDAKMAESGVNYDEESEKVQDLADLKTTPNYGVEVNADTNIATVKPYKNCVIVTAFERIRPTNADTIKIDDTVAKINVSYTNENWVLTAYAYKEDSTLVAQVSAEDKNLNVSNIDKNIRQLALVFFNQNGIKTLSECEIDQIGCNVVFKPFVMFTKHNLDGANNTIQQLFAQDDVINEVANPPEIAGVQFDGWYFGEDDNAVVVTFPITMTENKDIYARFSCKLTKHNVNNKGGKEVVKTKKNESITLDTLTLTDYIFDGWFDGESEDAQKVTKVVMETNKDVYARWKPKPSETPETPETPQNNG